MVTKFRRNAYKVVKGPAKPAAAVARPPGWCLLNTEAREAAATVCARRGLATTRPDAWEAFPDQGQAKVYLTPAKQGPENFDYQWSKDGNRSWINLFEVFDYLDINIPAEKLEKFPVSIEQHPELGWALVLHLNERSQTTPEDLADVDEAAAAGEMSEADTGA